MSNPLISIIIPCYNGEQYLEQTLKSVLWQTYRNWECILIDDGSTDQSADIFRRYQDQDRRFRYYIKKNGGLAAARNTGIDLANGEYIQFLDADDILLEQRLEQCLKYFDENAQWQVLYSDYTLHSKRLGFFKSLPVEIPGEDQLKAFLFEFNKTFVIPVHSYLFRSEVVKKNKFDKTLKSFAEDNEYRIRLALQGIKFQFINELLVIYRVNENQVSSLEETKVFQNMLQELKKYKANPLCGKYHDQFEKQFLYLHQRIAISFFMKRKFRKGFSELKLISNSSSLTQLAKVLLWALLMVLFTKDNITNTRSWLSTTFNVKIGGWKLLSTWSAPKSVIDLMKL